MVSLQEMRNNYERGVEGASDKWKQHASRATDEYREGLMAIEGINSVSSEVVNAYERGISQTSAQEYATAVEGKSDEFVNGFEEAIEG